MCIWHMVARGGGGTKSCWFGRSNLDWVQDDTCRSKIDGST